MMGGRVRGLAPPAIGMPPLRGFDPFYSTFSGAATLTSPLLLGFVLARRAQKPAKRKSVKVQSVTDPLSSQGGSPGQGCEG